MNRVAALGNAGRNGARIGALSRTRFNEVLQGIYALLRPIDLEPLKAKDVQALFG